MDIKQNIKQKTIRFLTIVFMTVIMTLQPCYVYAKGWGLRYEDGKQPSGEETREFLKEYNSYYVGNPEEKTIYMTFDAGYENGYTVEMLNTLKKHNVPAAFFVLGTYIRDNPEIIKQMIDDGHIVGNHTMSHPDMSNISDKESFLKELTKTEDIYKSVTGKDMPKYYRPPQGKYSKENLKMASDLGYKTIFWSLAYVDWNTDNQPSKEQAFSRLKPRIHPGAVILLHNTSKTNSIILGELIEAYKNMGYEFKSLDHLIGL